MPSFPRLLVAGLSGGSGKTLVSLGILLTLRRANIPVRAFKKGPDYIDPAWLSWASGQDAHNLDTFLMGSDRVSSSFQRHAINTGVNLIEGNRGLFDGVDAKGTHSSAVLAHTLSAPVILVLDCTKMTRTAAALVIGCKTLDPTLDIRGIVLNNVNGQRHERVLRAAIESTCPLPIVGALPRTTCNPIVERHLGLVTPQEHDAIRQVENNVLDLVRDHLDIDTLLSIARSASPLPYATESQPGVPDGSNLRIGILQDSAFSFYYPESLEELRRSGAEIIPISSLDAAVVPKTLHALYIGGGFPETHAARIARNTGFLASLRHACSDGLPVYAECGGLMLLARTLVMQHRRYAMAGVFPIDVEVFTTPQGHGYSELRVDAPNPFFSQGSLLRGHEFHYSRIVAGFEQISTACSVMKGVGCGAGRDGLISQNVMAGYTHLHAVATPEWVRGVLDAAQHRYDMRNRPVALPPM